MNAAADVAAPLGACGGIFADGGTLGRLAAALAGLIDPAFLAEAGWDRSSLVLSPPPDHRLLGRPVCRTASCSTTAPHRDRICGPCRRRLAERGLGEDPAGLPAAQSEPGERPGPCAVPGCAREQVSWASRQALCRAHLDQQQVLAVPAAEFSARRLAGPLPAGELCAVVACARQRRHRAGLYCEAHQQRFRAARRRVPDLDEQRWRLTEPPVSRGGRVSLCGLDPAVIVEVLFGLQQRCRTDGSKTREAVLRALCDDLRRQQVLTIGDYVMPADRDAEFKGLFNSLTAHARRALAGPETEVAKDEWDLAVFGHGGTLSFAGISQGWLRELVKRWAADDLPKRRSRTARAGQAVRHHVGCAAWLSESLRARSDRGEIPTALGRRDVEAFLNRLAYQQSADRISGDARIRACREMRSVLTAARTMGLTRPGGPAAGLPDDFAVGREDIPDVPERGETARDLPPEIMRKICEHLPDLTSTEMRTGIELAIDTGRRPQEICDLSYGCLDRDEDGLPVLVYDDHKNNRLGRRLPISENTARLIAAQQQRVRARLTLTHW